MQECCRARDEDGIGAIVSAADGELTHAISREVGLPVVEGVSAALKLAESLVGWAYIPANTAI